MRSTCTTLIMISNGQSNLRAYFSKCARTVYRKWSLFWMGATQFRTAIYDICLLLFLLLPSPWTLGRRFTFGPLLPPRLEIPRCLWEGLLLISFGRMALQVPSPSSLRTRFFLFFRLEQVLGVVRDMAIDIVISFYIGVVKSWDITRYLVQCRR